MRVCERCHRAFECVAESTLHLCKTCVIAGVMLLAPHDLPHNHNESAPKFVRTATVVVTSSTSASSTNSDSSGITWHVPPGGPSG
jgi:hypothetical protein